MLQNAFKTKQITVLYLYGLYTTIETKVITCYVWLYASRLALSRTFTAQHTLREAQNCLVLLSDASRTEINDQQVKETELSFSSSVTLSQIWC